MEMLKTILGQNAETRRRTIEAALMYVFNTIAAYVAMPIDDEMQKFLATVVFAVVEGFILFHEAHYKNNDHTEEGEAGTEYTRALKNGAVEVNEDDVE